MGARASENVDDSDAEDDDCVDDVSEQVGLSDRFNLLLVFTHASIPAYSLEISKRKCFFFIFISNIFLTFFVFHFPFAKQTCTCSNRTFVRNFLFNYLRSSSFLRPRKNVKLVPLEVLVLICP